ncbi:MAG TPA: YggS family pyridoxal phosphate-dependent enzyme [Cytophagaceae bacterium]
MKEILQNLNIIKKRISTACEQAGRNSEEIKLLLATKTVSPDKIKAVLEAGEFLIGENKVQELKEKHDALRAVPHETHFIGHLQTNKIKDVLKYADCVQSLDRLVLAEKLQHRLEAEDKTLNAFIQVNTSYEPSKFGVDPEEALGFAMKVRQYDRINIKGLMTIGLFSAKEEQVRKCFRLLKELQLKFLDSGIDAFELSMGMSNDLEVAIREGATMVRVGTAIFGVRKYPDSYYWNENS